MKSQFLDYFDIIINKISTLCNVKIDDKITEKKSLSIELIPQNEYGQEKLYISVYDNRITLSFDYYESFLTKREQPLDIFFDSIIKTIKKILKEELIIGLPTLAGTSLHSLSFPRSR